MSVTVSPQSVQNGLGSNTIVLDGVSSDYPDRTVVLSVKNGTASDYDALVGPITAGGGGQVAGKSVVDSTASFPIRQDTGFVYAVGVSPGVRTPRGNSGGGSSGRTIVVRSATGGDRVYHVYASDGSDLKVMVVATGNTYDLSVGKSMAIPSPLPQGWSPTFDNLPKAGDDAFYDYVEAQRVAAGLPATP